MLNSKDEIMLKFAENIGMHKTAEENALYWQNLVKNLIPSLITLPLDATGIGIGTTIFFAAAGLNELYGKSDNSLTELIEALDALDRKEGTSAAALIGDENSGWIKALKDFQEAMKAKPGQGQEYINNELKRIGTVDEIIAYLRQMQIQWFNIEQKEGGVRDFRWLGDWGDLGEAKITLAQTLKAQESIKTQIKAKLNEAGELVVKQYEEKYGKENVQNIARKLIEVYEKLLKIGLPLGQTLELNQSERLGLDLAYNIVSSPERIDYSDKNYGYMVALKADLDDKIIKIQKEKPKQKKSDIEIKPPISKRATEWVSTKKPETKMVPINKKPPASKGISQRAPARPVSIPAPIISEPIDRGENKGCPTMVNTKNLTDDQIDACLNQMRIKVKGKERYAKEYLADQANALTPAQRKKILYEAFGKNTDYKTPNEWMSWGSHFVEFVENNYKRSGGKYSI